jgi:hypothetical protein
MEVYIMKATISKETASLAVVRNMNSMHNTLVRAVEYALAGNYPAVLEVLAEIEDRSSKIRSFVEKEQL